MVTELMKAEEILNEYKDDVNKLAEFLPWLTEKNGKNVTSLYSQNELTAHSVSFPVYDATLMRFINVASETKLMDRNYRYVYTRNRIRTTKDELDYIEKATIQQMGQLGGILSNYVMGGRTRAKMWSEGMDKGIFLAVVDKCKELIDFWTNATVVKGD